MQGVVAGPALAGLIVTPVLISLGQVLFKLTGLRAAEQGWPVWRVLFDPPLIAALAIYGAGTLIWIHVLRTVPLSAAYPFMAMSFALVPVLSVAVFGETLSLRYALGVMLIAAGMAVVNS